MPAPVSPCWCACTVKSKAKRRSDLQCSLKSECTIALGMTLCTGHCILGEWRSLNSLIMFG